MDGKNPKDKLTSSGSNGKTVQTGNGGTTISKTKLLQSTKSAASTESASVAERPISGANDSSTTITPQVTQSQQVQSTIPIPDLSNLVRLRKSALGKSAPSLSANMIDLNMFRRNSRAAPNSHRLSYVAATTTSPGVHRSHSPVSSGSPVDSPPARTYSPNLNLVPQLKRGSVIGCRGDGRRWSVASLPSSGYGTTPGSSNMSSKCSSQERLHQLPHVPTSDELRLLSHHLSREAGTPSSSMASAVVGDDHIFHQNSFQRPRSRSLSSPSRSPVIDSELSMMNMLYKERFPKATQQMEERLVTFINENKDPETSMGLAHSGSDSSVSSATLHEHHDALPIARFVHHQVLEIARDCLHKSQAKLINSRYFFEISENLERLLVETREKSPEAAHHVTNLIKKLLLIISRPARLLECLEFDPEEFYHLLEAAEGQAKVIQGIKTDIPIYIIQKLGLNRDPIAELQQELKADWQPSAESHDGNSCTALVKKDDTTNNNTNENNNTNANWILANKTPSEDDYDVIKLISNGAYGAVYLVRHKQTRQRFAMKKINKNNLILRNQVDQVFAERDILSFADNPFVVSMYCSFETRRHLCLVMEYVEGGDCATLLKNIGPLPSDMARFYFAETVLAVEYLHSYGIVHRDLKPDNLLITVLGHIKLTDFGLSKMGLMSLATNLYEGNIDSETQQFSDKQVFGTPEYIAPEVILRQGYGKPVDWWSMGIILYEFLVGCVPFFGETIEELFAHTVNDDIEWPDPDDWPIQPEAKDLISALLAQNPRDRLGTAGPHEVKEHAYFAGLDWNSLLRQKAEFVPQLENEEDTSYFDSRTDRYNHEVAEDTDDTDDSPVFGSFSSCSPQYKKVTVSSRLASDSSISAGSSGGSHDTPPIPVAPPTTPAHNTSDRRFLSGFSTVLTPDTSDANSLFSDVHRLRISYIPPSTPETESNDYKKMYIEFGGKTLSTPESSQTDSDDVSPQIQRKRRSGHTRELLPRFAISMEDEQSSGYDIGTSSSESARGEHGNQLNTPISKHRSRSVVKSASATGLSLIIPSDEFQSSNMNLNSPSGGGGGGSSTASSRDTSPCRELSPLVSSYKPPIIIKRGPRGFGFTVHTIRVYYGDTDFYTMHHLVMAVDEAGPAYEAGLRPADLITHVNGEAVQGLYHTQVLQLLLGGGERVTLRATPLEHTSIQTGGRRRDVAQSKLARRSHRQRKQKRGTVVGDPSASEKRRKASLFRRISSKRASVEMQQISGAMSTPTIVTPPNRNQSFSRTPDGTLITHSPIRLPSEPVARASLSNLSESHSPHSPLSISTSSQSSSPSSSTSNTPTSSGGTQHYQRPSTLHGLKHKLHSTGCSKSLHKASPPCATGGPNRRKSVGHIPLSPLARTPSPSPLPVSPTRSPSPLAFPVGHQQGSSNTTQSYSPGVTATPGQNKKSYARPKSAEPGSPLLRRALSPDRLHPRSAEGKCTLISPLCSTSAVSRVSTSGGGIWRAAGNPSDHRNPCNNNNNNSSCSTATELTQTTEVSGDQRENTSTALALPLVGPGELLPRIAEEKDSPTNSNQDTPPQITTTTSTATTDTTVTTSNTSTMISNTNTSDVAATNK